MPRFAVERAAQEPVAARDGVRGGPRAFRGDRRVREHPDHRRGGPADVAVRAVWLGIGAVSFDLMLAAVVTSLLRRHLSRRAWRAVHLTAYVSWPVAWLHSVFSSGDLRHGALLLLAIACAIAVIAAALWRVAAAGRDVPRAERVGLLMSAVHGRGPAAAPARETDAAPGREDAQPVTAVTEDTRGRRDGTAPPASAARRQEQERAGLVRARRPARGTAVPRPPGRPDQGHRGGRPHRPRRRGVPGAPQAPGRARGGRQAPPHPGGDRQRRRVRAGQRQGRHAAVAVAAPGARRPAARGRGGRRRHRHPLHARQPRARRGRPAAGGAPGAAGGGRGPGPRPARHRRRRGSFPARRPPWSTTCPAARRSPRSCRRGSPSAGCAACRPWCRTPRPSPTWR